MGAARRNGVEFRAVKPDVAAYLGTPLIWM
jgi:hypothetical protein